MTTKKNPHQTTSETAVVGIRKGQTRPPLRVKLKDSLHPDCGGAYYYAWAANRLHFGIRIENMADDEGNIRVEVTLYEEVPTVDCRDVSTWWPMPEGWTPEPAIRIHDDDLWDALNDARWEEDQGRAYMLRVRHDSGCCSAARSGPGVSRQEWFVDFSELELAGDLDYRSFPHKEVL